MKLVRNEVLGILKVYMNNVSTSDFEVDNDGQLMLYTGIFQWSDGEFYDEPEGDDDAKG
jgi:hypothetical protein